MNKSIAELEKIAHEIRIDIARMFYKTQTGHFAPALSCVDILTTLYFGGFVNPDKKFSDERDRVILSKGHAAAALYATLAKAGYFAREELLSYYDNFSRLGAHPVPVLPGVETVSGSLGHGICYATGVAKAAKIDDKPFKTYVILGDGESEEGSVYEAAMFASAQNLDNLIVIMDYNKIQGSEKIEDITRLEPVVDKWAAFGWNVLRCDGNDCNALCEAMNEAYHNSNGKPSILIADTLKGKGVSFVENNVAWHSRAPKGDEWQMVCDDLQISLQEVAHI